MPSPKARPHRRRWTGVLYVGTYLIVAAIAGAYLAGTFLRPDLVEEIASAIRTPTAETTEGDGVLSTALADINSLRQDLGQAQLDIAKIKTEVEGYAEHGKVVAARLDMLDERTAQRASEVMASSARLSGGQDSADATTMNTPGSGEVGAPPPAAGGQSAQSKADHSTSSRTAAADIPVAAPPSPVAATIETGSVAKTAAAAAPVAFGPAIVKKPSQPAAVQIATSVSVEALKMRWGLLSDNHPDALKGLQARYISRTGTDSGAPSYDLVAGPIKSAAEARTVCKTLQAQGVPCAVGVFTGDAL